MIGLLILPVNYIVNQFNHFVDGLFLGLRHEGKIQQKENKYIG
jgi:hypothetical protein